MEAIVITSENLITNRKVRENVIGYGNLADSGKEALAFIHEGLKQLDNPKKSAMKDAVIESSIHKYTPVGPYEDEMPQIENKYSLSNGERNGKNNEENTANIDGNTLQLNVKLFLPVYNKDVAMEAVNYVGTRLSTTYIDNVYVTVPANAIAYIGLASHSSDTEAGTTSESDGGNQNNEVPKTDLGLDPERRKYADDMVDLWNHLSKMESVDSLGLCDVETDVFKEVYREADIKPKNVQVNLKSCCVVPPELREFANANNIKLLTHSDSPEFLGDDFCSQINNVKGATEDNQKWKPLWIIRFQVFKKMRGVLQDKRYMIALQKDI